MKNIDDYLSLNYHKRLYQDDGDWIIEVDDLPGCIADGGTPDEAVENLRHAMRSWIESRLAAGLEVPEPSGAEEYSGKILVRMPRFLHRRLSLQAKAEGVSLNQYLGSLLADASARVNVLGGMQSLGTLPVSYSFEPTNAYVVTAGSGQANWLFRNCWAANAGQDFQGSSLNFRQLAPQQFLALQPPKENA